MTLTAVLACNSLPHGREFASYLGWRERSSSSLTWEAQTGHIVSPWFSSSPMPEGNALCVAEDTRGLLPTKLLPAIVKRGRGVGTLFLCPATFEDSPWIMPLESSRVPCHRAALPELFEALGLHFTPPPTIPMPWPLDRLGFTCANPLYSDAVFFLPSTKDVGL